MTGRKAVHCLWTPLIPEPTRQGLPTDPTRTTEPFSTTKPSTTKYPEETRFGVEKKTWVKKKARKIRVCSFFQGWAFLTSAPKNRTLGMLGGVCYRCPPVLDLSPGSPNRRTVAISTLLAVVGSFHAPRRKDQGPWQAFRVWCGVVCVLQLESLTSEIEWCTLHRYNTSTGAMDAVAG